MKRYPIGVQDFFHFREDGYCYVDKTERIHDLITTSGKAVFLARPRRFGKSLLCSTLAAIFEARRELFDGLAIDKTNYDWKKYPVLRIDLNAEDYSAGVSHLEIPINTSIELCAKKYAVPFEGQSVTDRFRRLLVNLHKKFNERVVVIIDEYDKPLLVTMDKPELQTEIRGALKPFFAVLKACDEHLKFSFLTGVTKFSKVAIFSDLNNLDDISMNPKFADLCGITQDELETVFADEIIKFAAQKNISKSDYVSELKYFYNGYRFTDKPLAVYNPFGLLNHFKNDGAFDKWWYESATPTFLIDLIEQQKVDVVGLESQQIRRDEFSKFDIQGMGTVPTMYQSGYLTIVDYNTKTENFTLGYPNSEVRSAFANELLKHSFRNNIKAYDSLALNLPECFANGDIDTAMKMLISFLSSIPYDIQPEQECYYQTVVHLVFNLLGTRCRSEVRTADGRIDSVVEIDDNVYVFEFKLDATADEALKQINSKEYTLQWNHSNKKVYKIGVSFDSAKRNIGEWKVE